MADYDVIILGGGPGGYIAAERLAHGGKKVLLIEEHALGGTCLNVGCIPTKALLHSVKLMDHARHGAQFGVRADSVTYDWTVMQEWKARTVTTLVGGVSQMMKKLNVEVVFSHGRMITPNTVEVAGERHHATDVIIATGSRPSVPPIPGIENNPAVLDATALLSLTQVPSKLTIIGGGVIGVEFASLFSRLGTVVTIVEALNEILPFVDPDMAQRLRSSMPEVDVRLSAHVDSIEGSSLTYTRNGSTDRLDGDLILVATGRQPLLDGWGADTIGLDYSPAGIQVNDQMRTNLAGVWAVGDVTGRSFLAHGAYRMGEVAAQCILDPGAALHGARVRLDWIPWALYTSPEAAGVGLTEKEAATRGIEVEAVKVPLVTSGRFVAEHGLSRAGLIKLVAERESRVVCGIHVIGPYAPEMIWGAAAVLEMEFTVEDLRQLVFPHPTISEGIRQAAWAFPDQKRRS